MAMHYFLLVDEIMIIGKENTCRYKTVQQVSRPEDVWSQEVKIVDPYGDHELSGYFPNDKWEVYDKDGTSPISGYKLPKCYGRVLGDASVWKYLKYKSWGDEPQEVRVFRDVYELELGKLPTLVHRTESRYGW